MRQCLPWASESALAEWMGRKRREVFLKKALPRTCPQKSAEGEPGFSMLS